MPDILTTFLFRLSGNPGSPASWTSKGFCRPVYGQLYLGLQLDCITFFYCTFAYINEFCSHSKGILQDKILKHLTIEVLIQALVSTPSG